MKKTLRFFLLILAIFFAFFIGFFIYALSITSNVKLDKDKFVNTEATINYFDDKGRVIEDFSNNEIISIDQMPKHLKNAFIAIEDKRFYSHNGIDYKGMVRATAKNVFSFSLKEGGSTITQQLIKNTHLSNEKTIKRKLIEVKLAKKLEKSYSKDQILEKYLNTIYFGSNCFGVAQASKKYFSKSPKELSISESAVLASIIKSPATYSPFYNYDNCIKRRNLVLEEMFKQGYIDNDSYIDALKEIVVVEKNFDKNYDYMHLLSKELDEIIDKYNLKNQKINVYTYCDYDIQKNISSNFNSINNNCSAVVLDINSKIKGYYSTCGNINRQLGSTVKPLLVYAPAIEHGIIDEETKILDEKTNFNGYEPSNYNSKYYGFISAKEALGKSLNVCAVKILNDVGIDKAKKIIQKTDVKFTENDDNLAIALGCSEKGSSLLDITSTYNVFSSGGYYSSPTCIYCVKDNFNRIIYKDNMKKNKILSNETAFVMNDMLLESVENGTAKKLSFLGLNVRAKTGTVGNKNGNTDAYTISYTPEYSVGVWLGSKDGGLMDNSITGGSLPSQINAGILSNIYSNKKCGEFFICDSVKKIVLDKISYDEDNVFELADKNAPKRYCFESYFLPKRIPKKQSYRFSVPKIENAKISVNSKGILLELCLTKFNNALIYKTLNDKKTLVVDLIDKNYFIDYNYLPNQEYVYSIIPYIQSDEKIIYGEEVFLNKIKSPANVGDLEFEKWWIDIDD